jgi:hypothetical protein
MVSQVKSILCNETYKPSEHGKDSYYQKSGERSLRVMKKSRNPTPFIIPMLPARFFTFLHDKHPINPWQCLAGTLLG